MNYYSNILQKNAFFYFGENDFPLMFMLSWDKAFTIIEISSKKALWIY